MREFEKSVCKIAIPVTLQCMLQSSFSIVDQLMIGQLGSVSISAVGLGGNFSLIFNVVIGAVAAVAGILIAQFIGAKEEKEAWHSFFVSILIGSAIALLFMLVCLGFTRPILQMYTKDLRIVDQGITYFKLIALTFLPMGMSSIIATWMRCNEHASIPLFASLAAVLCNTGLNYLLIFGKLGLPALGAVGAGYATVISQLMNFCFILIGFVFCIKMENHQMDIAFCLKKVSLKEYVWMIAPIMMSEFLWSLGQNIFSAVYGHIGTGALAAYTLTTPIQGLLVGALSGLSAAAGVMIGKLLGEQSFEQAFEDSKKLLWLGFYGSVILAVVLVLCSRWYVSYYPVERSIQNTAHILLILFAIYAPVKVENMILGGGIIRSGGNTKMIMLIDIIGTWMVGIPLCLFAAYILNLGVIAVYAILSFEEVVRFVITIIVFNKKSWMKHIGEEKQVEKLG